jgi:hypothetical protein
MNCNETVPLSQHDILDSAECEDAAECVLALRSRWSVRTEGSFYTLGAASYMDATKQHAAYSAAAAVTNPILEESFDWLLERVREFFEELLGETVSYDTRYALPGFHIFVLRGEDRSQDNVAARAHFDLQWMHAIQGSEPSGTLSFTLPVREPTGGASMEIWPARYQDAVRLGIVASQYAASHSSQTVWYSPGRIVVHDGYVLHAIGRAGVAAPKGMRITLQGHGVRLPRGWILYW